MSNVLVFPAPNLSNWPESNMSDRERDLLIRTIQNAVQEQPYPLNHLLPRFALIIRDYPVEDVQVKSLDPCGYLMSFNYPTYHLHWLFRMEGKVVSYDGPSLPHTAVNDQLEKGAWSMGVPARAVRFFNRFLRDLQAQIRCDSVVFDDRSIVVSGMIQASAFQHGIKHPHYPFTAILSHPKSEK